MKTYGGVALTSPFLTTWHHMEVSGQLYAPAALLQGKNHWYPLARTLNGPTASLDAMKLENFDASAVNKIPVVQSVAHRYTK
jgi:hypothetical protein